MIRLGPSYCSSQGVFHPVLFDKGRGRVDGPVDGLVGGRVGRLEDGLKLYSLLVVVGSHTVPLITSATGALNTR